MSLRPGSILRTNVSRLDCIVRDLIGEGGQGAVYRVTIGGETLALKWYYPKWLALDPGLRTRLAYMVERGSPSDRYLWPIEIVSDSHGAMGYVMNVRPPQFSEMTALLAGRIEPSFKTIVTAAIELAHNFHELHALGLSYQDVSPRNVFIDERSGEIRICDCDNVSVNNVPSAIGGTIEYMAPEVGMANAAPSGDTDRYSLAVLLFEMLMLHHPLLGARELRYPALTREALTNLYHRDPLFIFDPLDPGNRPLTGRHDRVERYWQLYPQYVRDLFVHAFTTGLVSPESRVYERKWREALARLRDEIMRCPSCAAENFLAENAAGATCWSCEATIPAPLRIRIGAKSIVLGTDTQLLAHHVDPSARWDFDRVVASVARHPSRPDLYGLRNETADVWTATASDGRTESVVPRRVVGLHAGTSIAFGTATGVVSR